MQVESQQICLTTRKPNKTLKFTLWKWGNIELCAMLEQIWIDSCSLLEGVTGEQEIRYNNDAFRHSSKEKHLSLMLRKKWPP